MCTICFVEVPKSSIRLVIPGGFPKYETGCKTVRETECESEDGSVIPGGVPKYEMGCKTVWETECESEDRSVIPSVVPEHEAERKTECETECETKGGSETSGVNNHTLAGWMFSPDVSLPASLAAGVIIGIFGTLVLRRRVS